MEGLHLQNRYEDPGRGSEAGFTKGVSVLKSIKIKNYKSIVDMDLPLGRFNVFIGENGAGKSNILEAIALAGAASARKLDNEFLTARGIRVTLPQLMHPAFEGCSDVGPINIEISEHNQPPVNFEIKIDNAPYSKWRAMISSQLETDIEKLHEDIIGPAIEHLVKYRKTEKVVKDKIMHDVTEFFDNAIFKDNNVTLTNQRKTNKTKAEKKRAPKPKRDGDDVDDNNFIFDFMQNKFFIESNIVNVTRNFIIYSPEHSALRIFEREGQIEPLGINGEGLLKLLSVIADTEKETFDDIKECMKGLGWFEDFEIIHELGGAPDRMEIQDIYLKKGVRYNDQKSANEGFLFLAFYFALFSSKLTPNFFAVDNIDASLNPKLCEHLTRKLARLATVHGKQALLTTHNPAVLDGLNLDDEDQRLFIVSRNMDGHTQVRRFKKPTNIGNDAKLRLSESFLRGDFGGLPKGF